MPEVHKCITCGSTDNLDHFSLRDNGMKCNRCSTQDKGAIAMSDATKLAIQYIVMAPPKKLFSFHLSEANQKELSLISKLYLDDKLDKEYR